MGAAHRLNRIFRSACVSAGAGVLRAMDWCLYAAGLCGGVLCFATVYAAMLNGAVVCVGLAYLGSVKLREIMRFLNCRIWPNRQFEGWDEDCGGEELSSTTASSSSFTRKGRCRPGGPRPRASAAQPLPRAAARRIFRSLFFPALSAGVALVCAVARWATAASPAVAIWAAHAKESLANLHLGEELLWMPQSPSENCPLSPSRRVVLTAGADPPVSPPPGTNFAPKREAAASRAAPSPRAAALPLRTEVGGCKKREALLLSADAQLAAQTLAPPAQTLAPPLAAAVPTTAALQPFPAA